ncbi:MAG: UDP-N-acetylmuramate--L-alanine ligase [Ignavibacteriaceae bacterium]|nr:UDP-N-acetylmuramate--L-alanine ligase [Ignavibacteriaceae bacterium]
MRFFNHIHFVAISGSGISPIAELWLRRGYKVSGSDQKINDSAKRLQSLGATIYEGHSAANLSDSVDLVVYSSAIREDNPELKEAAKRGIPFIKRPEMLKETMRPYYGIGVAGTHGKTTTTSMTAALLIEAGLDPSVIVGGQLDILGGGNARLGKSDLLVIESDEYDRTFLSLTPAIAVITNVEAEHLDTYRDLDDIKNCFTEFANKVPFYGFVAACSDEPVLAGIIPAIKRNIVTYGLNDTAEMRGVNIKASGGSTSFDVLYKNKPLGSVTINLPGLHNVKNALGAITVAHRLGCPFDSIQNAFRKFTGARRRFEIKYDGEVMMIDDYGHHPTETAATVNGIKAGYNRRLISVFQPHNYSRTKDFYREFAESFMNSDVFVCTDIYTSRETPIEGISGELIVNTVKELGHKNAFYVRDKHELPQFLMKLKKNEDIILTIGAGDITSIGDELVKMLRENEH